MHQRSQTWQNIEEAVRLMARKRQRAGRTIWRRARPFLGGLALGSLAIILALFFFTPEPPPEPQTLEIPTSSPLGLILLALLTVVAGLWALQRK